MPTTMLLAPLLLISFVVLPVLIIRRHRAEALAAATTSQPTSQDAPTETTKAPKPSKASKPSRSAKPSKASTESPAPAPAKSRKATASKKTSRRSKAAVEPSGLRPEEEVRLLRLQVETLTEALRGATAGGSAEGRVVSKVAVGAATLEHDARDARDDHDAHDALGATVVTPAVPEVPWREQRPVDLEQPADAVDLAPVVPTLEPATRVAAPVPSLPVDEVARHYTDLSHSLAGAGRLREAVLAQWAADLRQLAPMVGERSSELYEALLTVSPADAASALAAARAVAASLVGPEVRLDDVLADTSHLVPLSPFGRMTYTPGDVSPEVLPDDVVRALESVLLVSATQAEDATRLSVGLRCDLVAHAAPGRDRDEVAALVRDVLAPHERDAFDARMGLVGGAA